MDLKIEPREEYLSVLITGDITLEEAKASIDPMLSAAREFQKLKILIDVSGAEGPFTTLQRFEFSKHYADTIMAWVTAGKIALPRIALYGLEPVIDPHRFGETVATNRGMAVKVTTRRDEAFAFLGIRAGGAF